ncbi:Bug family tripartite tricarboxylate transporter substrate binding protein [Falsirhodobacter xinxiangensis]|uniref:Bug family tripartite tricarboxylate transporter substrate binding protein n=1 Tax=Falsirhodobacter xinxiangensis TaxID=2530049 RepID=UPI0010A9BA4C|nr:tripartite tricarboxylate transporter substrate binding protein [Rhodobacter xinxiangensis]
MQFTRRFAMAALGAAGLAPRMAFAQSAYPVRRLTIVVPFDAGGSADRMARAISTFLPMELGDTPVTVVNRPGGSGVLGHSWFIRQPNDGSYALVSPVNPYLISSVLRGQGGLEWDDFHHVNGQWQDYYVVLTNKAQPYQSMAELLADIKANPGKVSCAVIPGDGGHLSALILLDAAGIPRDNVNWITYDGGGPMRTAIAGDQVTMTFISALGSDVIADQVRPLAIYRTEPDELWGAPTINDSIADLGIEVPVIAADLRTFTVHKSMMEDHPETYEMLVAAYRRMLEREDFTKFITDAKIGGEWMGPEATAASLQASYDIFAEHVDEL